MSDREKLIVLDEAIAAAYGAVFDESKWADVMRLSAQLLEVGGASLLLLDKTRNCPMFGYDYGNDPAILDEYHRDFAPLDPMYEVMTRSTIKTGEWVIDQQSVPAELLKTSPFYHEFYRKAGVRSMMVSWLYRSSQFAASFSLQRFQDQPEFDDETKFWAARLFPHLHKSVEMRLRIADMQIEADFRTAALQRLVWPIWVVDGASKIHYCNSAAEHCLNKKGFLIKNNSLSAVGPARALFESAVKGATKTNGVVTASGFHFEWQMGSWNVLVMPQPVNTDLIAPWREPMALVVAQDPAAQLCPPEELMQKLFNLTPAEVRLAILLVNGASPAECSEQLHVTIATIRTQIRALYNKTGARRMPELIRLLHGFSMFKNAEEALWV